MTYQSDLIINSQISSLDRISVNDYHSHYTLREYLLDRVSIYIIDSNILNTIINESVRWDPSVNYFHRLSHLLTMNLVHCSEFFSKLNNQAIAIEKFIADSQDIPTETRFVELGIKIHSVPCVARVSYTVNDHFVNLSEDGISTLLDEFVMLLLMHNFKNVYYDVDIITSCSSFYLASSADVATPPEV